MNYEIIDEVSNEVELDKKLIEKLLIIEDKRFFNHNGVDFIRIIGAFISNIKAMKVKEGASTITQQVYDIELQNESLKYNRSRTYSRKVKQILFALKYEKSNTKKDILYYYITHVYLGDNIFGFKKGAEYYFNKSGENLNFDEIVFLLKRVKRPNDLRF